MSVIEDLAKALGTSITELLTGDLRKNENISGNMRKMHFYVCSICGNIITSVGQGVFSCCGITLYEEEAEKCDDSHFIRIESFLHTATNTECSGLLYSKNPPIKIPEKYSKKNLK